MGLSRRRLAEQAGVSEGAVRYVEDSDPGIRSPGISVVERLADAMGLSPCWLAFSIEGEAPFRKKTPGGAREGDLVPAIMPGEERYRGLPARLKAARALRGLSGRALGRAAGTSGTAIQQLEDSRSIPSVATAEKIAAALVVSPCWLCFGTGQGPEEAAG